MWVTFRAALGQKHPSWAQIWWQPLQTCWSVGSQGSCWGGSAGHCKTEVLMDIGDRSGAVQVRWAGGQPQTAEGDSGRLGKGEMIQEKVKPWTFHELLFLVYLSPFVISIIYSLTFLLSVMRVIKGLNSSLYTHRNFLLKKKLIINLLS